MTPATVTVVSGGTTTGRDGMPGCTNFNDGANKVLCVFETTEGAGTFTIKSVVSANDGSTWGGRSLVYAPTGTNNGGTCLFSSGHLEASQTDKANPYRPQPTRRML